MDPDDIIMTSEEAMEKAVDYMTHEFAAVRTGKASGALVENIDVEAYGSQMKLKQLALISTPEPRLIVIQPFDGSTTHAIEKALRESRIGINPNVDGKLIRLPIPPLTEERRRDMVKVARKKVEESRVAVRNIRRDAHKDLADFESEKMISKDDLVRGEEQLQRLTDRYVIEADKLGQAKEAEIMEV